MKRREIKRKYRGAQRIAEIRQRASADETVDVISELRAGGFYREADRLDKEGWNQCLKEHKEYYLSLPKHSRPMAELGMNPRVIPWKRKLKKVRQPPYWVDYRSYHNHQDYPWVERQGGPRSKRWILQKSWEHVRHLLPDRNRHWTPQDYTQAHGVIQAELERRKREAK